MGFCDGNDLPPLLPPLVRGEKTWRGPFRVTVTDEMVRAREMKNAESTRRWQRERARSLHLNQHISQYFDEFEDPQVRRRFVRRVFTIVALQLIFTAFVTAGFLYVEKLRAFVVPHSAFASISRTLHYVVLFCVLFRSDCMKRGFWSVAFPIALTVSVAFSVTWLSVHFETEALLLGVGFAALIALTISCVATFTKFELTAFFGSMLIVVVVGVLEILTSAIAWCLNDSGRWTELTKSIFGALAFDLYVFCFVRLVMHGHFLRVEPGEIIDVTRSLYFLPLIVYWWLMRKDLGG